MTNRNSSNINIPEAREAMDKFKMEAASDVGVPKHETKNNTNIFLKRLIIYRPLLYNEDGDEK